MLVDRESKASWSFSGQRWDIAQQDVKEGELRDMATRNHAADGQVFGQNQTGRAAQNGPEQGGDVDGKAASAGAGCGKTVMAQPENRRVTLMAYRARALDGSAEAIA
jgi:hypothetical protein